MNIKQLNLELALSDEDTNDSLYTTEEINNITKELEELLKDPILETVQPIHTPIQDEPAQHCHLIDFSSASIPIYKIANKFAIPYNPKDHVLLSTDQQHIYYYTQPSLYLPPRHPVPIHKAPPSMSASWDLPTTDPTPGLSKRTSPIRTNPDSSYKKTPRHTVSIHKAPTTTEPIPGPSSRPTRLDLQATELTPDPSERTSPTRTNPDPSNKKTPRLENHIFQPPFLIYLGLTTL
jgi:hypothetical protein